MTKEERRNAIKVLIGLREAGFPVPELQKLLKTPYILEHIKELAIELGSKFIRQELENEANSSAFLEVKKQFTDLVKAMHGATSPFHLVFFASDLLQFYVVASEPKWQEQNTTAKVTEFLKTKQPLTGNCDGNLFVLEFKVLTMYNELITLQEGFEHTTLSQPIILAQLSALTDELVGIKKQIDTKLAAVPDNCFALYLKFAINYTCAKIAEVQFQVTESELSEADKLQHADVQKVFLKGAKEDLEKIKASQTFSKETGKPFAAGEQYCYGRSLLRKLPSDNLEVIMEHVAEIAAATI